MTETRPALSNLLVCLTLTLQDQHPNIFEAIGRKCADEGDRVCAYDTLSALSGRDFDACFEALERAAAAGLLEQDSAYRTVFLTADGATLADKSHLDPLDLCRRHVADWDDGDEKQQVLEWIDAAPRTIKSAPATPVVLEDELPSDLDEFDEDVVDDDIEEPAQPRRLRR